MSVAVLVENKNSIDVKKHKVYMAFRDKEINKKTFLKEIDSIENPIKRKNVKAVGQVLFLLISILFPLLFSNRMSDRS
jgi:hypothetical protein